MFKAEERFMTATLSKTVADFETQLAVGVSAGATTMTLVSATDDDGVALASGTYGFTIDLGNSMKEYVVGSLVGTAITAISSVTRQGVATSGFARAHRRGAKVVVTDWVILKRIINLLDGTTDLDASTPLKYDGTATLSNNNHLATVGYVLSVVTGGTVTFDKQTISVTAGETIVANDVVYLKESDSRWWKVDADTSSTTDGTVTGIAISGNTAGNSFTVQVSGIVTGLSGLTANSKYYASNTAGGLSLTAGTNELFIGYGLTTTTLFLAQRLQDMPTAKEKDAMVGTVGVPQTTNKFVTNANTSSHGTDQSQTTRDATIAFGEASTTGLRNKVTQSFVPTTTKISGVSLYKIADTGTFTGTVTVSIQADTAGAPSGSALATVTLTNAQWQVLKASSENYVEFATEYTAMVVGSMYYIVFECSTGDSANHPNLGTYSLGGYSSGGVQRYNATDGWVAVATIDLYFKTFEGVTSQLIKSTSAGEIDNVFTEYTSKQLGLTTYQTGEWITEQRMWTRYWPTGAAANTLLWNTGGATPIFAYGTAYINNAGATWTAYCGGQNAGSPPALFFGLTSNNADVGFSTLTAANKIILETAVYINSIGTGDFIFCLDYGAATTYATNSSGSPHIACVWRSTGDVYLQTGDGSATAGNHTETLALSNMTVANAFGGTRKFIRIRLELDPTSQARLYVDGNLVASHSTNLPSGSSNPIAISYIWNRTAGNFIGIFTAPVIAIRTR